MRIATDAASKVTIECRPTEGPVPVLAASKFHTTVEPPPGSKVTGDTLPYGTGGSPGVSATAEFEVTKSTKQLVSGGTNTFIE